MKVIRIIFICSVIKSLRATDRGFRKPRLVFPREGHRDCIIGEDDCTELYEHVQERLMHSLNNVRYAVTKGKYALPLPVATNMLYLERDQDLELKAKQYFEICFLPYDPDRCAKEVLDKGNEEMILSVERHSASTNQLAGDRMSNVINRWGDYNAAKEDLLQFVKAYNPKERGLHDLAVLLNAKVSKVGCWVADLFVTTRLFKEILLCVFGPPKLVDGQEIYKAGSTPCSHCPPSTSCLEHSEFPNALCDAKPSYVLTRSKDPLSENEENLRLQLSDKPPESIISDDEPENPPADAGKESEKVTATSKNPETKPESQKPSEIATTPSSDKGSTMQTVVPISSTQECVGNDLCSPGWKYEKGNTDIQVRGECKSMMVFQEKLTLQESLCFDFIYIKQSVSQPWFNKVIAFAFNANNKTQIVKAEQNEEGKGQIYLDIPWKEVEIHVGFGTISQSKESNYMLRVNGFHILAGGCPRM